jgi:hypothetical protein
MYPTGLIMSNPGGPAVVASPGQTTHVASAGSGAQPENVLESARNRIARERDRVCDVQLLRIIRREDQMSPARAGGKGNVCWWIEAGRSRETRIISRVWLEPAFHQPADLGSRSFDDGKFTDMTTQRLLQYVRTSL